MAKCLRYLPTEYWSTGADRNRSDLGRQLPGGTCNLPDALA